jgi:hypothetical protein
MEHDCDCPAHTEYPGLCKHLVALLYKMCSDQGGAGSAPKPSENRALRTDSFASLLLSRYAARERAVAEALALSPDQRMALLPHLTLSSAEGGRPMLSLSVGCGRMYVVRSAMKFAEDVRQANQVSYGKGLAFAHVPERFHDDSRPLLKFVLDQSAQVSHLVEAYGLYRRSAEDRMIPLAPDAFDRFFALYAGREVGVTLGGREAATRFVDADPPLTLAVRERQGGLEIGAEPYALVAGSERQYLMQRDALYRLSEHMTAQAGDFLAMLRRAQFRMELGAKDLPVFCGDVLPGVRACAQLTGDVDAIEQYRALPLEVKLYLDIGRSDEAYMDAVFLYGDRKIRPYAEDPAERSPVARDRREEARALAAVARYFPLTAPDGRAMASGEELLFALVDEWLEALREVGELYLSDRARRLSAAPQPKVAVRASLDEGLLSLDVDVGEFPREELTGALAAYRERRRYHRLRDGRFLRLEGGAMGSLAALADGLDLTEKQLSEGQAQLPAYRALYLDRALRDDDDVAFDRDAAFRAAVRGLRGAEDGDFRPPASLNGTLRKYQQTGFQWLKAMQSLRFHGILADDMGLGKTVQVIALLLSAYEEGEKLPSLIVCPASLVLNWMAEIARFAPTM